MLKDVLKTERPTTAAEVLELVADAGAVGRRLEVIGGGTKRSIGAVRDADALLSLASLSKLIDPRMELVPIRTSEAIHRSWPGPVLASGRSRDSGG